MIILSRVTQALSYRWSALKHKKPFIVRWVADAAESWKQNKTKNKTETTVFQTTEPKPNRNAKYWNRTPLDFRLLEQKYNPVNISLKKLDRKK